MRERNYKKLFFLILILFILLGAVAAGIIFIRSNSVEERINAGQNLNLLLTVHDYDKVIFCEALFFNPATQKSVILYLPPESWFMLESFNRYDKLEKLYQVGNPDLLREKIERLINIKIPYQLDLSIEELGRLVDLLGGLEVFIPEPVQQKTETDYFLFEAGSVVLDGDKAQQYLKLAIPTDGEMEKAQRKQDFFKSLLVTISQRVQSGFLLKASTQDLMYRCFKSNLTNAEFRTLIQELGKLNSESVLYRRLHGVSRLQNKEYIFFPNDQGEQLRQTMGIAMEYLRENNQLRPEDLIVTLEILNGTDIPFRARDTAKIYRKYGYEVLREDNAPQKPVANTVIIDHKGNEKVAKEVAAIIKCKCIETAPKEKPSVDISVIIGLDFDGQYCK